MRSRVDPSTSSFLYTIWIKIHDVPEVAREVELVKEITALVAEPLAVDELSLVRSDAVRVQARCRDPNSVNGELEFFYQWERYILQFEVEQAARGSRGDPAPGQGAKKPEDRDKNGSYKGERMDREGDTNYENYMEENLEGEEQEVQGAVAVPIAAVHPTLGAININHMENMVKESIPRAVRDKEENLSLGASMLNTVPM